eukprot:TRINITY_DN3558_c0_g1_i2.p1 TRINITY_DN3558_c0_g1~~TRINITY_DN3558_c0_g1_i2.p1  ORF type:complete len:533 (-),score=46.87 TRINITY_DN3558_c0_g1_i2:533-2131(-)
MASTSHTKGRARHPVSKAEAFGLATAHKSDIEGLADRAFELGMAHMSHSKGRASQPASKAEAFGLAMAHTSDTKGPGKPASSKAEPPGLAMAQTTNTEGRASQQASKAEAFGLAMARTSDTKGLGGKTASKAEAFGVAMAHMSHTKGRAGEQASKKAEAAFHTGNSRAAPLNRTAHDSATTSSSSSQYSDESMQRQVRKANVESSRVSSVLVPMLTASVPPSDKENHAWMNRKACDSATTASSSSRSSSEATQRQDGEASAQSSTVSSALLSMLPATMSPSYNDNYAWNYVPCTSVASPWRSLKKSPVVLSPSCNLQMIMYKKSSVGVDSNGSAATPGDLLAPSNMSAPSMAAPCILTDSSSTSASHNRLVKILSILCRSMVSDFDIYTLCQLDMTCSRMGSFSSLWRLRGIYDFYGLELEGEGSFDSFELLEKIGDWRSRYRLFYSVLPAFGVPYHTTRLRCTKDELEFAWCRVQVRPDLMASDPNQGVFIVFDVIENPDMHLALLLAGTSGVETDNEFIRFVPESGFVLR